ncbi:MAG: FAD-dependent oxidoreductase, partial [Chloroflexi bacterium]|nr:FAD-dependent oxidoreductase [Chloroflexota bacterium]
MIIGGGEAGQAAAHFARARGASVAIIDRELFGGSCPYWARMPSKALLPAAAIHAGGADNAWSRASDFRDWMIVRERPRDWPDDSGHVSDLEAAGATVIRGTARLAGPGRVAVRTTDGERHLGGEGGPRRGRLQRDDPGRHRGPGPDHAVDEPRGDDRPRAAQESGRDRRRTDGGRAVAGLRPLRRADRDGVTARQDQPQGPSAELGGPRGGPASRRSR